MTPEHPKSLPRFDLHRFFWMDWSKSFFIALRPKIDDQIYNPHIQHPKNAFFLPSILRSPCSADSRFLGTPCRSPFNSSFIAVLPLSVSIIFNTMSGSRAFCQNRKLKIKKASLISNKQTYKMTMHQIIRKKYYFIFITHTRQNKPGGFFFW